MQIFANNQRHFFRGILCDKPKQLRDKNLIIGLLRQVSNIM